MVAGNSKNMPQAVEKALRQVFNEAFSEKSGNNGDEIYEKMAREERIQFETWG